METEDTMFAPAERADSEAVRRDAHALAQAGLAEHVAQTVPCVVMILNPQRQLIYANRRLLEMLGSSAAEELLGRRPGELLGCIHAGETPGGCGTTEFCRECGAVRAILKSQREKVLSEEECRISTHALGSLDLRVWASPYEVGGREYTVFSVVDVSDEKRRHALERTFFHDVNNILTVVSANSQLLKMFQVDERLKPHVDAIQSASRRLADEIQSQRKLLAAEQGELAVELETIDSRRLVEETRDLFAQSATWRERSIVVEEDAARCEIVTDGVLLHRILVNMVKNALEASSEEEVVRIGCAREGESVVFRVRNPNVMPRSAQLQIFQRSYSTKGKGRGVGTYSMKLFGEEYLKGSVGFTSVEGEGTTFFVSLPVRHPEARAFDSAAEAAVRRED